MTNKIKALFAMAASLAVLAPVGWLLAGAGADSKGAKMLRVPGNYPTLQAAIDAASDGDEVRLAAGRHCGAFLDKRLTIHGEDGAAIVGVGCDGPKHIAGFKVGVWIASPKASGSIIRSLTFDGAGVSNSNMEPLGAAIFTRSLSARDTGDYSLINDKVNDIVIEHNKILGTIQGVTNAGGDNWLIHHNTIEGLSVFDCVTGRRNCGGGDGIVLQINRGVVPPGQTRSRPTNNTVAFNKVSGSVPDTLTLFSMVAVFMQNVDGAVVQNNKLAIPDNPNTDAGGIGMLLTKWASEPGSTKNKIVNNDGRGSEYALIVDPGNTSGLTLRGNFGTNLVEDTEAVVKNRSIKTLKMFD